jgi:hypothetical protein
MRKSGADKIAGEVGILLAHLVITMYHAKAQTSKFRELNRVIPMDDL